MTRPVAYVAVVGPGDEATPDECRLARDVGRLIAERGAVVITGGLGGVMAAAAYGASDAGGTSIGLLPGPDRASGNSHTSLLLPTGLGEMRNALIVRSADGVIAVGGSWGTLSEVALAERTGVPVVRLGGWIVDTPNGVPIPQQFATSAAEAVNRIFSTLGVA